MLRKGRHMFRLGCVASSCNPCYSEADQRPLGGQTQCAATPPGLTTREGCYKLGKRPLLSERTTPSTRWPLCGGCLEKPAASGEEQHHEEIARYPVYQDSACSRKRPKRLSLAGYGVNPVGRPGAPTTTTTTNG